MDRPARGSCALEPLRVGHAAAGDHPVDLTRPDGLLGGDTVAMHDLPGKQVRHRRQPDVRMGAYVDAFGNTRREVDRTEVVEENERPDHPVLRVGQYPADLQSA